MSEEAVQDDFVQEEAAPEAIEDGAIEESGDDYVEGDDDGVQAESVEELEEELQEAADAGASEEELKSMIKEFELKVNGKTLTKKIDLSDEDAVKRELQKAYAGQLAMQEKAELENALRGRVDEWRQDPWKFFEELGMDADELAEMRMAQRLEEMKKDPKQLEDEKRERELEELRQQLKAKEEEEERREYNRMQEEAAMALDNEISDALEAHGSLPATPRVIKQIASTLYWATTPKDEGGAGFDPDEISVKDVLPTVEKELKKEIADLMASLPAEVLEQYIGNQGLEKIKKKAISKVKKTVPKSAKSLQKPIAPQKKEVEKPKKRRSVNDFLSVRNR